MKTIVTVNTELPTVENYIAYQSGKSLLDYDIVLFDPQLPYQDRINFSGGGSCISIEGTRRLKSAMEHWAREFTDALNAGKTIFILLNSDQNDQGASGYSTVKTSRSYSTYSINNYSVLPLKISIRNAQGKYLKIIDSRYKGLHDAIKDITEYKVVFTSDMTQKIFSTKDGSNVISATIKCPPYNGNIVLLPYFDFEKMRKHDSTNDEEIWTKDGMIISKKIVSQLIEIDKTLKSETFETPKPEWIDTIELPQKVVDIDSKIQKYEEEIIALTVLKNQEIKSKNELLKYSALLYENGKELELAIERSLQLMGYLVQNFQENDIEIDHIITHKDGVRMIGESEGKDNSAIDISKFRQLETNINEDFARESVLEPAKGLLFGNGFRLTEPSKRGDQFTQKCLTNAKRLGTALIKTADLYKAVLHILDNPKDERFKKNCRKAIESTNGYIVEFPNPIPKSK